MTYFRILCENGILGHIRDVLIEEQIFVHPFIGLYCGCIHPKRARTPFPLLTEDI
jgi:hypothetical protein